MNAIHQADKVDAMKTGFVYDSCSAEAFRHCATAIPKWWSNRSNHCFLSTSPHAQIDKAHSPYNNHNACLSSLVNDRAYSAFRQSTNQRSASLPNEMSGMLVNTIGKQGSPQPGGNSMSSSVNVLSLIRQNSIHQTISSNVWLFHQGDPVQDVYLLEKGLVKMLRLEANGNNAIAELRFSGTLLGAASALANALAPMAAYTLTECKVARLSVQEFLRLEQSNASFAHELLVLISQQKQEQSLRYIRHATFSARAQLAQLLLLLCREFGREKNGEMCMASPLTKQDMAAWVGIAPQHLSALLREMKNDGLIAEEKGWLILRDLALLQYEAETDEKTSLSSRSSKGGGGISEFCFVTEEIFSSDLRFLKAG
jgi:CRP/FNR family transcriptional regulator